MLNLVSTYEVDPLIESGLLLSNESEHSQLAVALLLFIRLFGIIKNILKCKLASYPFKCALSKIQQTRMDFFP
jgi:hypothetical protein